MSRIALVNLRFKVDIQFEVKESLGLAYIASMLLQHGHHVDLIDAQFDNMDTVEVYRLLVQQSYDLIGFSIFEETMPEFVKLLDMMGSGNAAHLCLGGHYASFSAERLLRQFPQIDTVVIGEGELTMLELVGQLPGEGWKQIDGLCYLQDGRFVTTSPRWLIKDLDEIPYPYRERYFGNGNGEGRSATVSASRGCYASCSFCSIQSFYGFLKGKRIRVRNPVKVVDEMEYVHKTYHINRFFFADDNFLSTNLVYPGWVDTFVSELQKRELGITFDIDCRVNDVDEQLFRRLKKAGLNGVFLGIESFSQRALDTLNKKVLVEDNVRAINLLHSLRITVWMGFIMFDMFTTLEEIRENIKSLHKIRYFTYFNYDRPLSGDRLASPLKLYNGTPILRELSERQPEILVEEQYGYDYRFVHSDMQQFYQWLLKWKEVSKEMIQLDTLWLIRKANESGAQDKAKLIHSLSRKYMRIDLQAFQDIMEAVERRQEETIDGIIALRRREFQAVKKEIELLRESLA